MPDPANYETEKEFMAACVPIAEQEGMKQDQAVAVCLDKWRNKSMKEKASKNPGDYLVVEDPEKPSTWHLQVKRNGTPDHNLMGAAWAALHGGYRGNRYEGPDKEAAIRKLTALYESEGMETPKAALEFEMLLTKAEPMNDGRVRWQARANTGQFDLENERFDKSFWDDVIHNFALVQEETSKGGCCDMPVPILDLAHYSFRLPAEKRNMARAGYPIKLWQDGQALMAQGYFDDTPLGRAAAEAAASRPVSERRVSIGVWPDWGRVELDGAGRRTYKGGRNRAYLDHLAMTGHPVDPGTVLEVKNMGQKQDAIDVLGDSEDALALIDELEAATTKALPEGAVEKADEVEPEAEVEKAEDEPEAEPQPEPITADQLRGILERLFASFGEQLNERLSPMETAMADIPELKAQIDALQATETEKVKAAIDSDGDLWTQLVKNSVQRQDESVKDAGPEEKASVDPNDPFNQMFEGLRKPQ